MVALPIETLSDFWIVSGRALGREKGTMTTIPNDPAGQGPWARVGKGLQPFPKGIGILGRRILGKKVALNHLAPRG